MVLRDSPFQNFLVPSYRAHSGEGDTLVTDHLQRHFVSAVLAFAFLFGLTLAARHCVPCARSCVARSGQRAVAGTRHRSAILGDYSGVLGPYHRPLFSGGGVAERLLGSYASRRNEDQGCHRQQEDERFSDTRANAHLVSARDRKSVV